MTTLWANKMMTYRLMVRHTEQIARVLTVFLWEDAFVSLLVICTFPALHFKNRLILYKCVLFGAISPRNNTILAIAHRTCKIIVSFDISEN